MKRMSLILGILVLVLVFGIFLAGCTTTVPLYYSDNPSKEFVILGEVVHESGSRTGFTELLAAARRLYPDADYVIDVMVDDKTVRFLGLKLSDTYILRGTAIRYVN